MFTKKTKLSTSIALIASITANAAIAQSEEEYSLDDLEEIVVTSYRRAQEAALDKKRNSANNVSSIIAEDIGKMPDLNLAESLQRSPGVAITREGGEGRQITVRGLGPQYTRVTMNGMEIPSSTGGLDSSGGVNRSRAFDFNIFSADMFREITINKNAVAHVEEGGLASTVELFTLRPLDKPGLQATGSVQYAYNKHTGETDPRLNGLVSNSFFDDRFGVLLGVNFTERTVNQEGFGTVRWTAPASNFRGPPGSWGWADNTATINGTPNISANYPGGIGSDRLADIDRWNSQTPAERLADEDWDLDPADDDDVALSNRTATFTDLDYIWSPRLPRMDSFNHDQSRDGVLLSFQGRPTDQLELSLNHIRSSRESDVRSYNYFAQFRNLHNSVTPVEVTLDPSGQYMTAGSFSNVQTRSESRGQFSETEFEQTVLDVQYDFSDDLVLEVMYGEASSDHREEQYRYNMTSIGGYDFSYSFLSNSQIAEMSYGFDITDPANYTFTGPTHRQEAVIRDNSTFRVDVTWDFDDNGSNVKAGFISNEKIINSIFTDDPNGLTDPNAPSAVNTNRLSEEVSNYGDGIGGPSGFPTDWLVADFDVVRREYSAGRWNPEPDTSNTYRVTEETEGFYVEGNYRLGEKWWFNGGVRFVETTVQGNKSDLKQSYNNTLPAININFEPIEDVLLRASYSENIQRPNPRSISGAINYTTINGNVGIANPGVGPETSDSLDLAAEWYFSDESFVGITVFQKDISDAIVPLLTENTALPPEIIDVVAADPVYDPNSPAFDENVVRFDDTTGWNVTQSVNSSEVAELNGYEIGFQHVFPIGVGVLANYTYIDSNDIVNGLSENSYNLGVFYENETLAGRLVLNDRDDYITRQPGSNGNAQEANTGPTRIDFSGSYNLTENISLTLEVINLTNEKERKFTTGPQGDLDLVREYNTTGTEVFFGVRASF